MIEALPGFPENVLAFACHGHVTRQDYETVLVPAVTRAVKEQDKIRLYYETASDFSSVDAGAVWEDTKVGLSHLSKWEKMAVVTDIEWIRHAMQLFGFLFPGEIRAFTASEAEEAQAWIRA